VRDRADRLGTMVASPNHRHPLTSRQDSSLSHHVSGVPLRARIRAGRIRFRLHRVRRRARPHRVKTRRSGSTFRRPARSACSRTRPSPTRRVHTPWHEACDSGRASVPKPRIRSRSPRRTEVTGAHPRARADRGSRWANVASGARLSAAGFACGRSRNQARRLDDACAAIVRDPETRSGVST